MKPRIEIVVLLLSTLTSFKHQIFIKGMDTRKSLPCKTIPTQGKDFITKRICKENKAKRGV